MKLLQQLMFAGIGMATTEHVTGINGSSAFATRLFAVLCNDVSTQGENILISPLSIIQSLGLLKDGATATSGNHKQLTNLVDAPVLDPALSLLKHCTNSGSSQEKDVELSIATSLWTDSLKQSYIDLAKSKFSADILPLIKQDLFATINQWVTDQTNGIIKDLFDPTTPVDPNLIAVLVNAVYFKGSWSEQFDKSKTVDGVFSIGSKNLPARFMSASRKMQVVEHYKELGGASVLVLDYGTDSSESEYSAIFMLPADSSESSMIQLITELQFQPMSNILEKTRTTHVNLSCHDSN
jgi:serpin B